MNNRLKTTVLFFLFFAFQLAGQYGAGRLAEGGSRLFVFLLYGGFFLRSLIWIEILRDMRLISAYSISSLSYILIPVLSTLLLDEVYTPGYAAGGLLILAGVTIFSVGEQKMQLQQLEGEAA